MKKGGWGYTILIYTNIGAPRSLLMGHSRIVNCPNKLEGVKMPQFLRFD